MLNSYYTEALLGIKDAIISKVEKRSQEPIIDIWFSLKRDIHECPRCHELTETIHDYRKQTVKGIHLGNILCFITTKKDVISVLNAASGSMKIITLYQGIIECLQVLSHSFLES